jgi:hypothetical protein
LLSTLSYCLLLFVCQAAVSSLILVGISAVIINIESPVVAVIQFDVLRVTLQHDLGVDV